MDRFASTVFKSLLREISAVPARYYGNQKGVIQSSVGMIFRVPNDAKVSCVDDLLGGSM